MLLFSGEKEKEAISSTFIRNLTFYLTNQADDVYIELTWSKILDQLNDTFGQGFLTKTLLFFVNETAIGAQSWGMHAQDSFYIAVLFLPIDFWDSCCFCIFW